MKKAKALYSEKNRKFREIDPETKRANREKAAAHRNHEKDDVFSAQAIEARYYGSAAQSRSNSPAPSYKLSPATTLVDWAQAPRPGSSGSRYSSVSSLQVPQQARKKPSPLRVASYDPDTRHTPSASFGSVGGAYMSPLPSPRSFKSSHTGNSNTWVSPLDVHFSRPSTPKETKRPTSYLPRLQFPEENTQGNSLMPTLAAPGMNPGATPFTFTEPLTTPTPISAPTSAPVHDPTPAPTPIQEPAVIDHSRPKSPTLTADPQPSLSIATRRQRSIFPANNDDAERPSSRRSNKSFKNVPFPPLPQNSTYFAPRSPGFDQNLFPESPRWNTESVVIRESAVSIRSVSIYRPKSTRGQSPDTLQTRGRAHSRAASSVYSARTSILNNDDPTFKYRSQSSDSTAKGRNRSRSSSQKGSRPRNSLARTRNSIRLPSREISRESLKAVKRRSRERDQIHYDPSQHLRNRSGSVQGRSVDFDRPRESPFSNANAISIHSASSSQSSSSSLTLPMQQQPKAQPIPKPFLELDLPAPDRLSVFNARGRSTSDVSQTSMGDFYDNYYRNSNMSRASNASQMHNAHGRSLDLGNMGVGIALTTSSRKPAPTNHLSGGAFAGETIIEMPSPIPSPRFLHGEERYPALI